MADVSHDYPEGRIDSLEAQMEALKGQVVSLQESKSYGWLMAAQGAKLASAPLRSLGFLVGMLFLTLGGYALYFSLDPRRLAEVALPAASILLGFGLRVLTDWYSSLTEEVADCKDTSELERTVIRES
jgi:hypothetical protein